MKAVLWTKYGSPDGLQLQEVDKPVPKDNEVLIRIHATTVTAGDSEMRRLKFPLLLRLAIQLYNGLTKPRRITILGQELAGEIEEIGKNVTQFKEDDQVYAATDFSMGAYAEYICIPEDGTIAIKPANLSYTEAAVVPVGGLNALHFLTKGNLQSGQRILINGAGGSIGTIAIQLAKSYGAKVTAVDSSRKMEMLRSIGADHVIDYTQEDFTKRVEVYDVIFDVVGKASYSGCIRSLKENGTYLLGNPSLSRSIRGLWTSMTSGKKVFSESAEYKADDLVYLKELIEAGTVKPVIDRSYPLDQVAEAHRFVEKGGKKGNIAIMVTGN